MGIKTHRAQGRPILMPDARRWDDIFERTVAFRYGAPDAERPSPRLWPSRVMVNGRVYDDGPCRIGPFCSVHFMESRGACDVVPRPEVLDLIERSTVNCGQNDTISFEAIERADGKVLIVAQHGVIIGSLWLALLPSASSLPKDIINAAEWGR